jgi:hypothetical protein
MQGDDNEASAGQDKENRVKAKSEKFDPGRKVEEKKNEKHSGFTELSVKSRSARGWKFLTPLR